MFRSTLNITYDVDNQVKEQSDPLNIAFIDNDLGKKYIIFFTAHYIPNYQGKQRGLY